MYIRNVVVWKHRANRIIMFNRYRNTFLSRIGVPINCPLKVGGKNIGHMNLEFW